MVGGVKMGPKMALEEPKMVIRSLKAGHKILESWP